MNYFSLFGLPPSYNLDEKQLISRYQALQRQFHPDRFASCPENERLQAVQQSATINRGYQTLRQPLLRAEYLLGLHGYDICNEQHTLQDAEFLMEQMALREALEATEHQQDEKQLRLLTERIANMLATLQSQMNDQLNAECWPRAADMARKLRFLVKLSSQAEELDERFSDF